MVILTDHMVLPLRGSNVEIMHNIIYKLSEHVTAKDLRGGRGSGEEVG